MHRDSVIRKTPTFRFHFECDRCCANGCGDDGTRAYVERLGTPFKLVWYDEAIGYTRATNAGIAASTGEYLILMNNDVVLQSWQYKNEWIDMLMKPFKEDDKVAMTGPSKLFCEHTQEWVSCFLSRDDQEGLVATTSMVANSTRFSSQARVKTRVCILLGKRVQDTRGS
jgi:hypothetical protein